MRYLKGDGRGYAVAGGAVGFDGVALPCVADAGCRGGIKGDLAAGGGGGDVAEAAIGLADLETMDGTLAQGLVEGEDDTAISHLSVGHSGEGS